MLAAIESAGSAMLVFEGDHGRPATPVACCRIADRGDGLAYFGMFAVDPARQGAGTGRQVVRWGELAAAELFGARVLELEVLAQQGIAARLVRAAWVCGDRRDPAVPADPVFAVPMRDDLYSGRARRRLSVGGGAERV